MEVDDAMSVTTDAHENSYLENANRRLGPDLNPALVKRYEARYNNRRQSPKCLKEMELIALSNEIRRKCDWQNKVNDEAITAKWIKEATDGGTREIDIKYAIAELQMLASEYKESSTVGKFQPSPVDTVYQAESDIFPDGVLDQLRALGFRLEEEEAVDWHPGSNGLVRDLVHPSLYPLVLGVSEFVTPSAVPAAESADAGDGGAAPEGTWNPPAGLTTVKDWLSPYQWLPCEVGVDDEGKVTIDSYINNLHPKRYSDEYITIAKVIESVLPMFELTSTQIKETAPLNRLNLDGYWWETESEYCKRLGLEELTYDDDEYDDFWENYNETRILHPINPPEAPALHFKPAGSGTSFKGKNLQVIVKLANIHLTPEKPRYEGGTWHIEGEIQENIVSSAIVYYDMDNISESTLSFRASLDEEFYDYEQCDYRGVQMVYGFTEIEDGYQEYTHTQELGSVVAKEGRTVVFSNDLQHRVRPFELADKTRSGHRKILALFLVDPDARVVSTKDVGYQQCDWMHSLVASLPAFANMPPEIISTILDFTPGVMTDAEAKEHREKLMKARSMTGMASTIGEGFRLAYSLCEH
eukprot:m.534416 g.534416  ORF g.534416 m.534416 type:complete len:583 (-) comp22053_c0_seq4:194-1942(-)